MPCEGGFHQIAVGSAAAEHRLCHGGGPDHGRSDKHRSEDHTGLLKKPSAVGFVIHWSWDFP
jgi:hypothetical protein